MRLSDGKTTTNSSQFTGKSATLAILATIAILAAACGGPEPAPAPDPAAEEVARAAKAAEELQRRHDDDTAKLAARAADAEEQWKRMEGKIANRSTAPSAGLRGEVKEDIDNVREAIANLKTTSPENWWERHERALERTVDDIAEDVGRLTRKPSPPPVAPETAASAAGAPFQSRRDQFVARMRASVDSMEKQLEGVRARGAQEAELKDTRARIDKLQDDLDTLRTAEADDWWDVSVARVREYIDRVDDSIGRLDDSK
jgi:TolA-binding protein